MSITVADLAARIRADGERTGGPTREQVARVAAEFESMLMLQMLKEMRKAGSWDDEREQADGFGTQTMLETIDVELASHLTKAQGFGLAQQMLRELEKASPATASTIRPLTTAQVIDALEMPDGQVTSDFGWRRDPFTGVSRFHRGVDIKASYGQDIQAAAAGRVVAAGDEGGYGETVVIEHAGGVRTRYAHLSTTLVAAGDEVAVGQSIGRAGHSGRATGTHLHFEVTTAGGDRVNPASFRGFKADGDVAD